MSSDCVTHERKDVSMRVLCLGLGRTGSSSLKAALKVLDIGPIYSGDTITTQEHCDLWITQLKARDAEEVSWTTSEQWDRILAGYAAVIDSPPNDFALNLIQAYPDAKVILTVRDSIDDWYRSWMSTIHVLKEFKGSPVGQLMDWAERVMGLRDYFNEYLSAGMESQKWRGVEEDKALRYLNHIASVSNCAGQDRLLVYNVKDGWPKLCTFLRMEVPDAPFPNVNDTRQMVKNNEGWARARQRAIIWALADRSMPFVGIVSAIFMLSWVLS